MRNTGRTGSRSKSEVERLKRLAAKRVEEGATKREMEEEFDVCRQTLASYLEGLDIDYAAINAAAIAPFKQKMAGAIMQMADDVIAGVVNPKLAETWRGLMSDLRDMLPGMNAPTTSVSAHIHANAQLDPLYLDIRGILQDLEEPVQQEGLEVLRAWAATKAPTTLEAARTLEAHGETNPDLS
jgi:hypothetical protein